MRIKIGGIEIVDVTMDELAELIARYGTSMSTEVDGGTGEQAVRRTTPGTNNSAAATPDRVLLRRFVEAAPGGIPTGDVGTILGRGGKSIRPAAVEWAKRIGLSQSDADPFLECRVGTQRGMRITDALMDVARELAR